MQFFIALLDVVQGFVERLGADVRRLARRDGIIRPVQFVQVYILPKLYHPFCSKLYHPSEPVKERVK